jgi:hypothetical protein
VFDGGFRAVEGAFQVGVDDGVPVGFGHHHDQWSRVMPALLTRMLKSPKVSTANLMRASACLKSIHRPEGGGFPACVLDLFHYFFSGFRRFVVIDHHRRAARAKFKGNGAPNSARAAGDKRPTTTTTARTPASPTMMPAAALQSLDRKA